MLETRPWNIWMSRNVDLIDMVFSMTNNWGNLKKDLTKREIHLSLRNKKHNSLQLIGKVITSLIPEECLKILIFPVLHIFRKKKRTIRKSAISENNGPQGHAGAFSVFARGKAVPGWTSWACWCLWMYPENSLYCIVCTLNTFPMRK